MWGYDMVEDQPVQVDILSIPSQTAEAFGPLAVEEGL